MSAPEGGAKDPLRVPWRNGTQVGRTLYAETGDGDGRKGDLLFGMVDTPEIAEHIVAVHNAALAAQERREL